MKKGVTLLRLAGFIFYGCLSAPILAQHCTDIALFNFRHVDLDIASPELDANLLDKQFPSPLNRPVGRTVIHVRTHMNPTKPFGWTAQLVSDRTIHPQGEPALRVLYITRGNGGDGSDQYVLVYGCRLDQLQRLFQFSGIGIGSVHPTDENLAIDQWIWQKQDGHCCPTLKTRWTFIWDPVKDAFVVKHRAKPWSVSGKE